MTALTRRRTISLEVDAMKLLATVTLLFYLAAALPVRYAADDLLDVRGTGDVLTTIRDFYNGWSGRYTYALAKTVTKVVPVWLPAMLVILGFWLLVDDKLLLVACAIASPALIESLYWQSGLCNYGLFVLGVVACIRLRIGYLTTILLAFVIAGLSDAGVVALPVILVGWYAYTRDRRALVALVGALAGLAVLLAAPGNAVRMGQFQRADVLTSLSFAVRTAGVPLATTIRIAPVAVLAVLPLACVTVERPRLLVLPLVSLGLLLVTAFASYYGAAMPLVPRAMVIPIAGCLTCLRLSGRPLRWLAIVVFVLGMAQAVTIADAWLHVNPYVDNIGNAFK